MNRTLAATLLMLLALVACAKGTSTTSDAQASADAAATAAAPTADAHADVASASDGAGVYTTNCSSCHQTNGMGLSGTFPPLAGNPVVTGDPATVIHIVKYGLSGKIVVKGQTYNGVMPHWGQMLSDGDIAAAITYVRSSWGNHASAVSAADVTAVAQ